MSAICSFGSTIISKVVQTVANIGTKASSNPNTQKIVSRSEKIVQKTPSNHTTQNTASTLGNIVNTSSKAINNPSVNKTVLSIGTRHNISYNSNTRFWPGPGDGRVVVNGFEYSNHALYRMQPKGFAFEESILKGTTGQFATRGVPPSVVENAIIHGVKIPGNTPGEVVHVFDNVRVVTDTSAKTVITVITR